MENPASTPDPDRGARASSRTGNTQVENGSEPASDSSSSSTKKTTSPSRHRRWIAGVSFLAVGIMVWFLAREHLTLELFVEQEARVRATIEQHTWASFGIGFCIYTLVSMFPGTSGKSVLCGWLFGFWSALAMVTTALTLAAVGGFSVSRYVLRDFVRRRFADRIRDVDEALERDGSFYLLTVRMLHVPFTLVNYLCGASGLDLRTFTWTTAVGLVPSTMVFVGVGSSLPTLRDLLDHGTSGLIDPKLVAALVLMGLAPWTLRWLVRRFRNSTNRSAS
jgi:uncharacterized membrane protein YdjX (TVP38/TMEM64 family)